jgi:hypothetical protein
MNKRVTLAFLLLFIATPVFAARPMMTDDARIVENKACQLETWYKDTKEVREFGPTLRVILVPTLKSQLVVAMSE